MEYAYLRIEAPGPVPPRQNPDDPYPDCEQNIVIGEAEEEKENSHVVIIQL